MAFALLFGFLVGAVAVLALEGLGLYWLLQRLGKKNKSLHEQGERHLVPENHAPDPPYEKEGAVWVLDQEKLPKSSSEPQIKENKELKNKKEIVVSFPVKKNAKIRGHFLILSSHDGSQSSIPLLNCSVLAVSSSDLPSRKWYKKYPIRIESNSTLIYNGRRTCYLYLETSSEKESWCRALRLASDSDNTRIALYTELTEGFNSYLTSLASGYPLFQKPLRFFTELTDRSVKIEESSSRVRQFFRKVARKTLKIGTEKSNFETLSARGDKRIGDKICNGQDTLSASSMTRSISERSSLRDVIPPTSPVTSRAGNPHIPISDFHLDETVNPDEGTLCLNMLLARLFFDVKRSIEIKNVITARLQRALSNIRTPSYIGGITCTGLNVGTLPPFIHHVRTLPVDMKEMCALEVDFEYSGGFLIEIETRLDIGEPEFQGIVDTDLQKATSEDVASDLLEDFESYSNQFEFSNSASVGNDKQHGHKTEGLTKSKSSSWASTYKARWKTIVNSIADHVSQVPIALAIKVSSLKGTLCLQIKPPPSDQVWYGFTSMPEIDFCLDSSFGEHKFSNAHVGMIIANRIKLAIRDSIVLPNCESICIPWMSAEKDDWLPRSAAPYIWLGQENSELPRKTTSSSQVLNEYTVKPENTKSDDLKGKACSTSDTLNSEEEKRCSSDGIQPSLETGSASFSSDESFSKRTLEDLKVPLLENHNDQVSGSRSLPEFSEVPSMSIPTTDTHRSLFMQEDPKAKKTGRRARMLDLGKKMGEKFEEKKRHLGERSRHMVEKIRESSRGTSEAGSLSGTFSGSFR